MASKYRINRYNWFGQKLLAQHEYGDILRLRQYLVNLNQQEQERTPLSDHLSYIHGLALMKTSTHLDEIIFSLQKLNFDKNNQYFLLLCHCLLYSGNYDSVVALCKQVINKEIDAINVGSINIGTSLDESSSDQLLMDFEEKPHSSSGKGVGILERNNRKLGLDLVVQESFEFKRIFDNINKNNLINEPRLWFTFGLCLEFQGQFKDAQFALRVAARLASGGGRNVAALSSTNQLTVSNKPITESYHVSMSNFYVPHVKFAEFCIKHKADFKTAIQILAHGSQLYPHNYNLNPLLALCISAQPNTNQANFNAATDIISALESHSISNRNPSSSYNRLAIKCRRKLKEYNTFFETYDYNEVAGEEDKLNLGFLLVKAHVVMNGLIQNNESGLNRSEDEFNQNYQISSRIDKLLETLRNSDPSCRISASLWNNLGLCYLVKRRFIACFSCLSKAYQINPLDWRINYNLAAACVHVGLFSRALVCLLAAKSLYNKHHQANKYPPIKGSKNNNHPLIMTLLAVCYEKLGAVDESRRLHIESIRLNKESYSNIPIISLINYLIFLHNNSDPADVQHVKLKLHLLDQLEHSWLQRSQNDPQFNDQLLEIAQQIGEETLANQNQTNKKGYAWSKAIPKSELIS